MEIGKYPFTADNLLGPGKGVIKICLLSVSTQAVSKVIRLGSVRMKVLRKDFLKTFVNEILPFLLHISARLV